MRIREKNEKIDQSLRIALRMLKQQGRTAGRTVAEDLAGVVRQFLLAFQKCDGLTDRRTDGPTQQGLESRVRD